MSEMLYKKLKEEIVWFSLECVFNAGKRGGE